MPPFFIGLDPLRAKQTANQPQPISPETTRMVGNEKWARLPRSKFSGCESWVLFEYNDYPGPSLPNTRAQAGNKRADDPLDGTARGEQVRPRKVGWNSPGPC